MGQLKIENCINEICPWSGNPVSSNALTVYRGQVVGFCNPGCRDKFEKATKHFDAALETV
ncbi:MAG: glutathione S-transferase [Pseudomonadota bacterium]